MPRWPSLRGIQTYEHQFTDVLRKATGAVRHRDPSDVKLIVIHAMGEFVEDARGVVRPAWDFLQHIGLSAHYLITPSGVIVQGAHPSCVCWHAKGFNAESIGVEILVPGVVNYEQFLDQIDGGDWTTDAQYDATLRLTSILCSALDIAEANGWDPHAGVKRHSDLDPTRKRDPGKGFPWGPLISELTGRGTP